MHDQTPTVFSRFLLQAETVPDTAALARGWHDQTVTYCLQGGRDLDRAGFPAHLRRSFLGALARGGSLAAQNNLPCPWDPPCAFDIFQREQYRGARGDGLPKPYVLFCEAQGEDLQVSLRVFGVAMDWFLLAAEALLTGMRDILPWQKRLGRPMPPVGGRMFSQTGGVNFATTANAARLQFLTPVDISGKPGNPAPAILSRLLRRIDGLARWQGMALSPDYARRLAGDLQGFDYSLSTLAPGRYHSPNRRRQNRYHQTVSGRLVVTGALAPLMPLVALGERCHIGRGAVEGLGRYQVMA